MTISGFGGKIYCQDTDFTDEYRHDMDLWDTGVFPGEKICKATFIKEKVEVLLKENGLIYVRIGIVEVESKSFFTLEGINSDGDVIDFVISDYPCPKDCVPPENEIMAFGEILPALGNSKLDILAIKAVINYNSSVTYFTVRKGWYLKAAPNTYEISHIIYAATGKYDPTDTNSVTELKEPNNNYPIFISKQ